MGVQRLGDEAAVRPGGAAVGAPVLPGSKSLTNRYLMCAALADGRSVLRGASLSDDVRAMLGGLERLGVRTESLSARAELHIQGSRGQLPALEADIDVGAAGTAMRFLAALACLGQGRCRLDGSARMRQRPIGPLVDALRMLGALIEYEQAEGFPPVIVHARGLAGGEVSFREPPSSQYVSALLMAAPYAQRDVYLEVAGALPSEPYVEMTMGVMRSMGVEALSAAGQRFIVPAWQRYRGGEYAIEPDASAATYFWAAAAISGGRVRVAGLTRGSWQGDVGFVDVLGRMGAVVEEEADGLTVAGPASGRLRGVTVDLNAMPDTVQTLAVTALFAEGATRIDNVANLRVKETDRLAALERELKKLGAGVELRADGITVHPPGQIAAAAIDTYDDHRMAMSFALAGLAPGGVVIRQADCVSKSFPGFFGELDRLTGG